MSYPTSQVERNYVLYARMQNAKNLFTILKAINFKEVSVLQCEVCISSLPALTELGPYSTILKRGYYNKILYRSYGFVHSKSLIRNGI